MGMVYASANGDQSWRVVKVGGAWRIEQASVEAWLAASRTEQIRADPSKDRPPAC
jgi:hypothetical protein